MQQHFIRSSGLSISLSALALAIGLPACGNSDDGDISGAGAGGGGGQPITQDVGTILTSPKTCTEPHTICMNMQVPTTMEGPPTRLLFDLYDSPDSPATLPNGFAGYFTAPDVTAGEQLYFELSDANLQGDHWMFVIMYMEGGGYGAPVGGVDYVMHSPPAALHLDGTPINISDPVVIAH